jgi:hypothetical protein
MATRHLLLVAAVAGLLASAGGVRADVRFVDDDAPLGGDGLTWGTAYRFLQDALTEAGLDPDITEIRIGRGSYRPDLDEGGVHTPLDRSATFHMRHDLVIAGGYRGLTFGGDPDDRDLVLFASVLTGDLLGDDLPTGFINTDDNSFHVVTAVNVDPTAELDGVTVARGNAVKGFGGGLLIEGAAAPGGSSPTVRDCRFTLNEATHEGGGVHASVGSPAFVRCLFVRNRANDGGGAAIVSATVKLDTCTFLDNIAFDRGGGLHLDSTFAIVISCSFIGNDAGDAGGGLLCRHATVEMTATSLTANAALNEGGGIASDESFLTVRGGIIQQNSATQLGGGVWSDTGDHDLDGVIFLGNIAGLDGGALAIAGGAPRVVECTFRLNLAARGGAIAASGRAVPGVVSCTFEENGALSGAAQGGALFCGGAGFDVVNSVFTTNVAVEGGALHNQDGSCRIATSSFNGNIAGRGGAIFDGAAEASGASIDLTNSILWGDIATSAGPEIFRVGDPPTLVTSSDVQGSGGSGDGWDTDLGTDGGGNIDANPLFADDVGPSVDLHLQFGSPALDAGDQLLLPPDFADLDADGNTKEPLPLDRDGGPRVLNLDVDMGAYELLRAGACCFIDSSCSELEEADCLESGGLYQGDGVACNPCEELTGACCLPDETCEDVNELECEVLGGLAYFPDVDCAGGVCDALVGACCLPDGTCEQTDGFTCQDQLGGTFQGVGLACEPGLCGAPTGACCLPDGTCIDDLLDGECLAIDGIFQGGGSLCLVVLCPELPPIVFDPPSRFLVDGEPVIETIGDFDGANGPDVVVVIPITTPGPMPGLVQVFMNQGVDVDDVWLGFEAMPPITVGTDPRGVATGQIDDDGIVDIVVTNSADDTLSLLRGNGDGTFAPPEVIAFAELDGPFGVALADFTGNGRNDIIVTNVGNDTVVLLENVSAATARGGGGFVIRDIQCVGDDPTGVCPEDIDGDKDTDALVMGSGGGRIDGLISEPDFADGGGIFLPPIAIPVGLGPVDIAVGDLDGNEFLDILVVNSLDNTMTVIINEGGLVFDLSTPPIPIGTFPRAVAMGDFDGDDDLDAAIATDDDTIGPGVVVLKNSFSDVGVPALVDPSAFVVDANPVWVAVADLNGDGIPDVVTSNSDDGSGTGGSVTGLISTPCPSDLDGDGEVGFTDLLAILERWGPCPGCPEDIDGDGIVGMNDLLAVLLLWGGCPNQ